MHIERTNYWAKPGQLDAVLAARRKACDVRAAIGLPRGFICRKVGEKGPELRWTCVFASEEEYEHDMEVRATSPDFLVVREMIMPLLERFERHLEVIDESSQSLFEGTDPYKVFV